MEPHSYNVDIAWNKGRQGYMYSAELDDELSIATPPQFPGGVEGIWSPEHLFTASISSCLMTTFLAIAENFKLPFTDFECQAKGILNKDERGFLMTKVELYPIVWISDESDREKALKVLTKSEKACLISNSVKSEITMEPKVIVVEAAMKLERA